MGLAGGLASNGQLGTGAVGTVTGVTATNATIVVAGTGAAPTIGIGTGIPVANVTGAAPLASPNFTAGGDFVGIVGEAGIATDAIASGALPTVVPSSGTAFQCLTTRDVTLVTAVTATLLTGTATIALSPDNTTFSTLGVASPGVAASVDLVTMQVPAGWWVKLTLSNATVTCTYY